MTVTDVPIMMLSGKQMSTNWTEHLVLTMTQH